uniref:Mitochondrial import inner membrane translocase subunit n=1 Tax=Attheya septentrionalis TaxID=420275 RepID=A0A7S2U7A8_9STRA|mmetsp:Transcript_115/g.187  ORF Transcript_115/g.187 Transcript_115/m.187 type:complete len:127 (+) Transcript_115:36-416(+)
MGFWGKDPEPSGSGAGTDFSSSSDEDAYTTSEADYGSTVGPGGAGDIQEFSVALQQQIVVQQVVTKLSATAFEKCITGKPGEALVGKDITCINAIVNKSLDTSEFLHTRLARKQQQGASTSGSQYS